MVLHEPFEKPVHLYPDALWDCHIRSPVQCSSMIICVEEINAEAADWECCGFPTARRSCNDEQLGRKIENACCYPPNSRSAPGCISVGRSLRVRFPSASNIPKRFSSATASRTRSRAAGRCGSATGALSGGCSTAGMEPVYLGNGSSTEGCLGLVCT